MSKDFLNDDGPAGDDEGSDVLSEPNITISDGSGVDPLDELLAQQVDLEEREDLDKKKRQGLLRKEASSLVFRDSRITNVFKGELENIMTSLYGDDPEKKESLMEAVTTVLLFTGLLNKTGCDMSSREFSTEDIDMISPHVAKRIQHNLNMMRPRSKESARIAQLEEFEKMKLTHVVNIIDSDGMGGTAYRYVGGNEEFVTLDVDPGVVGMYSIRNDQSSASKICDQSTHPASRISMRWDVIKSFVWTKAINLVNGRPPVEKKKRRTIERLETPEVKLAHLNDADDAIFNGISKACCENYGEAVELCSKFNIDHNSIPSVMSANGYIYDSSNGRYVDKEDLEVQKFSPSESLGSVEDEAMSEISSLLEYLPKV